MDREPRLFQTQSFEEGQNDYSNGGYGSSQLLDTLPTEVFFKTNI
jgi:hypothetical protein